MKTSLGNILAVVATTVVVVSVIAGVIVVGSPNQGRLERLDADRIEHLTGIVAGVDEFWTRNERLPTTLEELLEDPRIRVTLIDPGSAVSYDYRTSGEETYELCAVFDRESRPPGPGATVDFWKHAAGRHCFELTVDTSRAGPGATAATSPASNPPRIDGVAVRGGSLTIRER